MDLLEYQAKQLFSLVGIPVLPSQPISDPSQLKDLHIPYPIVLKSQVRASARKKAGGVKFVENTIDAIAASQAIFNLSIEGEYPEVVLAEARYDFEDEFFLAIMLDYQRKCPVLLGSSHGGIDIESLLENMEVCVVEGEFSPFYARRLATKIGLQGELINSVSQIIEKMYHLFLDKDLEIIEINPLGINYNGELMALDGKIRVNDSALPRHPDLLDLIGQKDTRDLSLRQAGKGQIVPQFSDDLALTINPSGNIAIISNSLDLAILTANLLPEGQKQINTALVIKEQDPDLFPQNFAEIREQIGSIKEIEVVIVNILANSAINQSILAAIAQEDRPELTPASRRGEERIERPTGLRDRSKSVEPTEKIVQPPRKINWLVRIAEAEIDNLREKYSHLSLQLTDNLQTFSFQQR